MFKLIAIPFGYVMKYCYLLLKNYGLALVLFTFITKLLMFPLSVKQQKQTAKSAKLQPKLDKLKKKYGNNREKLNEEMTKLYAEEGVSMTGGCLPLILNFVLLFAMIEIIYAPITYITDVPEADINDAKESVSAVMNLSLELKANGQAEKSKFDTFEEYVKVNGVTYVVGEDLTAEQVKANDEAVEKIVNSIKSKDNKKIFKNSRKLSEDQLENAVEVLFENEGLDEYFADGKKVPSGLLSRPELLVFNIVEAGKGDFLPETVVEASKEIEYEMFGVFLGNMPSWKNILVLIPILSLILQLAVTIVSQKFMKRNNPSMQMGMGGMNAMLYLMPLLSFWIAFSFPAGVGIYWIAQSLFALMQTVVLNLYYTPERLDKIVEKENAKRKKSGKKTFMERALEAQMMSQNGGVKAAADRKFDEEMSEDGGEKKLSKAEIKELQRQRLNEARRRMAEKYGDEYKED
ncbi:MAG: membrane protein insertase YidC [Ruminococcus sp.]|nr:membrane protein insertase YidC [Ruminococcus sp.]